MILQTITQTTILDSGVKIVSTSFKIYPEIKHKKTLILAAILVGRSIGNRIFESREASHI